MHFSCGMMLRVIEPAAEQSTKCRWEIFWIEVIMKYS